jgi:hypothetical protein
VAQARLTLQCTRHVGEWAQTEERDLAGIRLTGTDDEIYSSEKNAEGKKGHQLGQIK